MHRNGINANFDGVQRDVAFGAFTAALPVLQYDPITKTIKGAAAAAIASPVTDDVPVWNGSAYIGKQRTVLNNAAFAGQSNSTTTFSSILGMTCALKNGATYSFDFDVFYTTAAGGGNGIGLRLTGPTTSTCFYAIDGFSAPGTRQALITAGVFGSLPPAYTTGPAATTCAVRVYGSCVTTAAGSLTLQFNSSGAAAVNLAGGCRGIVIQQ